MYSLQFSKKICATCPSSDCLLKCQYMTFSGHKEAHSEMMKVVNGKDSRVLSECVTCYACEEYCT
ncbi:MAG TPA: (Fe-S)-binding protein, partial [Syntrophaceae bacterium]|nr:(Fe-S)-binding protein [Syntrophaceae bacterium]HCX02027.1 (Fe-S)-binding protein [Syntrophaceae bacterium]